MPVWNFLLVDGDSIGTEGAITDAFSQPQREVSPTLIRLFGSEDIVARLTGTGFKLRADESFRAGTLTGATILVDGQQALKVTGLNIDVTELNDVTSSFALAQLMFRGKDKVIGTDVGEDLYGFANNDTIFGNGGGDEIFAGPGQNEAYGGAGADSVFGGLGVDRLYGGAGRDLLLGDGNEADDDEGQADLLVGGAGGDTLVGFGGNDLARGDGGTDILVGLFGNDSLFGGAGGDTVDGGVGKDDLFGGAGNDLVVGQQGVDRLNGGLGKDTLVGGDGADKFVFDTALGGLNADEITDFVVGQDHILLDNDIFKALTVTGDLAAGRFVAGTEAGDANDRIIYDSGTGRVYYDRDGNGSAAKQLIVTIAGAPGVTADDFLIIN